jgi:hypothetical protein
VEAGFRLAPAVALAHQSVVFRPEALLKPTATKHCHHAEDNYPDYTAMTMTAIIRVGLEIPAPLFVIAVV